MAFVVDTSDLLRLVRNCDAAAAAAPGELKIAMTRSVLGIEGDAKGLVATDTHTLQRSITHEVQTSGGNVVGRVGSNQKHARWVEEGTSPHWPPIAALAGWAGRKGIPAFLVARAIARRGTKARAYLKPALEKNRAAIQREFAQVPKRILAKLGGR